MIVSIRDGTQNVHDVLYEIEPEQWSELNKVYNHYTGKNITLKKLIDKFRITPSATMEEWRTIYGSSQIQEITIGFVNSRITLKRKENENE